MKRKGFTEIVDDNFLKEKFFRETLKYFLLPYKLYSFCGYTYSSCYPIFFSLIDMFNNWPRLASPASNCY